MGRVLTRVAAASALAAWAGCGADKGGTKGDSVDPDEVDADGDGFVAGVDCDDTDPEVHPAAEEVCRGGIDHDCDGVVDNCLLEQEGIAFVDRDDAGYLGWDVQFSDDLDGDGLSEMVFLKGSTLEGKGGAYFVFSSQVVKMEPGEEWLLAGADFILRGYTEEYSYYDGSYGIALAQPGDVDGGGAPEYLAGMGEFDLACLLRGEELDFKGEYDVREAKTILEGPDDSLTGWEVGTADLDGDDVGELLIGAPFYHGGMGGWGAVYAVNGAGVAEGTIGLEADADGTIIGNHAGSYENLSIGGMVAADFDADGVEDAVIGSMHNGPGAVYLFLGATLAPGGVWSIADADAAFIGIGESDGPSVPRQAGDVEGDGVPDLMILARDAENGRPDFAGEVYVWFGDALPDLGTVSNASADATIGGSAELDQVGAGGGSIGDVDRDGLGDVLIDGGGSSDGIGRANVFHGATLTGGGVLEILDADVVFETAESDFIEGGVAGGEDVTGDGIGDILIGDIWFGGGMYGAPGRAFLIPGW